MGRWRLRRHAPLGALWLDASVNHAENVVDVIAIGPNERSAAVWLAVRYRDLVRLVWRGPNEPRSKSVPWQVWEASVDEPCLLTVNWTTNPAHRFQRVELDESPDSVRVTVVETAPRGFTSRVTDDGGPTCGSISPSAGAR